VLDLSGSSTGGLTPFEVDTEFELFEKYTTFMYRPPEMIDKYKQFKVSTQVDVWMLGCVLYTMCFATHPFQDAQKLAIVNAYYFMPQESGVSDKL
jgi:AP2-associated kinase